MIKGLRGFFRYSWNGFEQCGKALHVESVIFLTGLLIKHRTLLIRHCKISASRFATMQHCLHALSALSSIWFSNERVFSFQFLSGQMYTSVVIPFSDETKVYWTNNYSEVSFSCFLSIKHQTSFNQTIFLLSSSVVFLKYL